MLKSELRKIYLERRTELSSDDVKEKTIAVGELFFRNFDLSKINYLHSFLPIERFHELDTRLILHRIWFEHAHIETLVPRVNFETGELENLMFTPVTELIPNAWMIHEPVHNELVASEKIDLIFVPLLAFDRRGNRVGYGKGFYDKLLKTCRADCVKVGLSHFAPEENIADVEEFDIRLDYSITPNEVFDFSEK